MVTNYDYAHVCLLFCRNIHSSDPNSLAFIYKEMKINLYYNDINVNLLPSVLCSNILGQVSMNKFAGKWLAWQQMHSREIILGRSSVRLIILSTCDLWRCPLSAIYGRKPFENVTYNRMITYASCSVPSVLHCHSNWQTPHITPLSISDLAHTVQNVM